jgi:hypothetical protein
MSDKSPFFVGYAAIPAGLKGFLISLALSLIAFFAVTGFLVGATQDDPGNGAFRFDWRQQSVTGVIEFIPYPVLRVTEGNERIPEGHTLMLTGQGKNTIRARMQPMTGDLVTMTGIILKRGDLDMLQVAGGRRGITVAEGAAPDLPERESLGRWRLAGEICDGKCLAGAMRPGRGLAHKACANLCLVGDIPPVFVSSQPIEGSEFLMVAGADGTPLPERAYDMIGQYVELEGEIERLGDLLILRMDVETMVLMQ